MIREFEYILFELYLRNFTLKTILFSLFWSKNGIIIMISIKKSKQDIKKKNFLWQKPVVNASQLVEKVCSVYI